MNYLKYEEYKNIGGICDVTAFNRYIDRACSSIDNATYNRVSEMTEIPTRVKSCCRDLVEYYSNYGNVSTKGVTSWSESAGAVSESVSYDSKDTEMIKTDVDNIIYDYLFNLTDDNGTPLLYKGAKS